MYFSLLHFCFGIGNLLGPVLAEVILADKIEANDTKVMIPDPKIDQLSNTDFDIFKSLMSALDVTNLQILHLVICAFLTMTSFMFVICHWLNKEDQNQNKNSPNSTENQLSLLPLDKPGFAILKLGFVISMTSMLAIGNGINFAYSNFITHFAVNSQLSLSKSQGARTTAIYFGASALMKFFSIGLLKLVKPIHLLNFSMVTLVISGSMLIFHGQENITIFQLGSALAGVGISTLFPVGVAWIKTKCVIGSGLTSLLIISTSIGAQLVKIPVAAYIETFPMALIIIFLICLGSMIILMAIGKLISLVAESLICSPVKKNNENAETLSEKALLA